MTKYLISLFLIFLLLLSSCVSGRKNFNKQKYTSLKKMEHEVSEEYAEERGIVLVEYTDFDREEPPVFEEEDKSWVDISVSTNIAEFHDSSVTLIVSDDLISNHTESNSIIDYDIVTKRKPIPAKNYIQNVKKKRNLSEGAERNIVRIAIPLGLGLLLGLIIALIISGVSLFLIPLGLAGIGFVIWGMLRLDKMDSEEARIYRIKGAVYLALALLAFFTGGLLLAILWIGFPFVIGAFVSLALLSLSIFHLARAIRIKNGYEIKNKKFRWTSATLFFGSFLITSLAFISLTTLAPVSIALTIFGFVLAAMCFVFSIFSHKWSFTRPNRK